MIAGTIMIFSVLAGIIALLIGAIGPGLGCLAIAFLCYFIAQYEFEKADAKRRIAFQIAYEKAKRETPIDIRNRPYLID